MNGTQGRPKIALVMAGGGARAAYQVGVLKALAEFVPPHSPSPFPIICGTSAGAINAAALAVYAAQFERAARRLEWVWANFRVHQVFRADAAGMLANWGRWWASLLSGGMGGREAPLAMFDRAPLRALLDRHLPCERIREAIASGVLHALSITASGYNSGQSVSFYQGAPGIEPWKRAARVGVPTAITIDHLMASSAIPLVFEAVKIHREYFGDGSMRQLAPLSPALHLGADRILVIGVRQERNGEPPREAGPAEYPSLAQTSAHVLASIFLDALEADVERLQRINDTVRRIPAGERGGPAAHLRPVDVLMIAPTQDIGEIAARHRQRFPRAVRYLLRGLGAWRKRGGNLLSYLLFEQSYTCELIALGYADTLRKREEVVRFLGLDAAPRSL